MAAKLLAPRTFAQLSGNTGSHARSNWRALLDWPRLWRCCELGHARQLKQTVAADMSLDVIRQAIQRRLDVGLIGEVGRLGCNATQPVVALPVVGKQAVDVTTGDAAGVIDRAFLSSVCETQQRFRTSRAGRASNVHLVSLEGRCPISTFAGDIDEDLVTLEHGLDIQQPKPRNGAGRSLYPVRIRNLSAEHLIAATNPEHMAAATHMRLEIDVPSCFAQRGEVGDGGLGTRQHHQRGISGNGLSRSDEDNIDTGLKAQRIKIIKIRDAGIGEHDDQAAAAIAARGGSRNSERIFRGQPVCRAMVAIPSLNRDGSPRNLLTTKPATIAASSAAMTALVPTRLAMTPPRSISPVSTTGTPAARAKPILAMSAARRFTSEAEPAPSTSTRSASRARWPKLSSTAPRSFGFMA